MTGRMNGSLYATSNFMDAKEQFTMTVVNRPILVLMGQYRFVAFKTLLCTGRLTHKTAPLTPQVQNQYPSYSGSLYFIFRFSIKAPNGKYLRGVQNGTLSVTSSTINKDCLWEY